MTNRVRTKLPADDVTGWSDRSCLGIDGSRIIERNSRTLFVVPSLRKHGEEEHCKYTDADAKSLRVSVAHKRSFPCIPETLNMRNRELRELVSHRQAACGVPPLKKRRNSGGNQPTCGTSARVSGSDLPRLFAVSSSGRSNAACDRDPGRRPGCR